MRLLSFLFFSIGLLTVVQGQETEVAPAQSFRNEFQVRPILKQISMQTVIDRIKTITISLIT